MKKLILILLTVALVLTLAACGKSKNVQAADDLIAAIGTVTLDSQTKIVAAELAVEALTDSERAQLENAATLAAARKIYDELVAAKKAQEEAEKLATLQKEAETVIAAIDAIGTVTLESQAAIDAAKSALAAISEEAKAYVTNLAVLEEASNALADLRAAEVIALIDAIGTVTLDSGDKITAAQEALKALDSETAAKVTNAEVLTNAANQLKDLKKAEGLALLKNFRVEEDIVRGMSFYYPTVLPFYDEYWGADVRCFALPYLGKQGDDVWLRLICNYTEDNWVFFEKITFAVDDARYYETFRYSDVVRDNAYGDVWEYVDMEVNASEIEMLWAIVNSNTTIIRFEGDDYYYDFTVSQADKDGIRQILTAYEALAQD